MNRSFIFFLVHCNSLKFNFWGRDEIKNFFSYFNTMGPSTLFKSSSVFCTLESIALGNGSIITRARKRAG